MADHRQRQGLPPSSESSLSTSRGAEDQEADCVLLGRFVEQWDEEAFASLVCRHGPMVLGVCRRLLPDADAAEDAFQVTFLLLVRKAGSVRKRGSVGPWLYGVARRVAIEARRASSMEHVRRRRDVEVAAADEPNELECEELHVIVHEELGRLPEKYRTPLVLCYFEGLTHETVAQRLAWPIGTVRVRIARGRALLGSRLMRRGITTAAVLAALGLLPKTAVAVPKRLIKNTVRAAAGVAAGDRVPREDVPARVTNLERRVRHTMRLTKLKWVMVIAVSGLACGAGLTVMVPKALAAVDDAARAKAEFEKLQGTWAPVSAEEGGAAKDASNAEQIKFDGETFQFLHNGHVEESGTAKVDPSKKPMHMDFQFQEGRKAGKTGMMIYAWEKENLKLCITRDFDKRPVDFRTKPGDRSITLVLKRQEP